LPSASAASIASAGVLGLATKNFDSAIEVPASLPLAQDGPEESCCTAGTKTSKLPSEFRYRNGVSSATGLLRE
jgi:hypothetical protein